MSAQEMLKASSVMRRHTGSTGFCSFTSIQLPAFEGRMFVIKTTREFETNLVQLQMSSAQAQMSSVQAQMSSVQADLSSVQAQMSSRRLCGSQNIVNSCLMTRTP